MKISSACACEFCEEFTNPPRTPNRILWEGDNFTLLPTIGALTPGYMLLMPKHHVRSFSDLPSAELRAALRIAEQSRSVISSRFGATILAEHGPGEQGTISAACCDHAHWHLIPCDPYQVAHAYEQAGGAPVKLGHIDELCRWKSQAYIFLSPLRHTYWVWPHSEAFPSQFARRVCARILGLEDYYDWAVFPFTENMILTRRELEASLHHDLGTRNTGPMN